jgi:hypothetical protein
VRRAAVPGRTVLLVAAVCLLASCGAGTADRAARPHFSLLCVDVGLPLTGPEAAAGQGLLIGLEMQIPSAGVTIGGYHVRLCQVRDLAAAATRGPGGVVAGARAADGDLHTIAYFGELSGDDAETAEAVLAQAGIPLVTPSGPVAVPAVGGIIGDVPLHSTALYLLPSEATQTDAVQDVRAARGCVTLRHRRPLCTVLDPGTAPLCTGISAVKRPTKRFCVTAGPDLSRFASPAVAYGATAGELLLAALRAVAHGGGDVADRATVLSTLRRARLGVSPIGAVRFDSQGAMEADEFSVYTVESDGRLVLSKTFRTH